jgi:hypothetical protein
LDYKGVTGANPRTLSFWFKDVNLLLDNGPSIIRWGELKMGANFQFSLRKKAEFLVDVCGGRQVSKPPGHELMDGKWHHVAVTLSGGGMLKDIGTYIDRKPVATSPYTPGKRATGFFRKQPLNTTPGTPVTIGSEHASGFIDEVMIWDRALDGVEIARLYKATGGQNLDPALEKAILTSNKLPTEVEAPAEKVPAEAGDEPTTGELNFSEWLKTVRFRSDNGIQLFIEGDRIRLSGIKGFHYQIDEKSRTVTWAKSEGSASITVSHDRKGGVWTMPNGVKHQLTVSQVKQAVEKPVGSKPDSEKPAIRVNLSIRGWFDTGIYGI